MTILTAKKQAFDAPLDLILPVLPEVDVSEVRYGRSFGVINRLLKSKRMRQFARTVRSGIGIQSLVLSDPRSQWRESAQAIATGMAKNAHVVVSTFGPPAAHLIANDMKLANPKLRWVADYRDLWSQSHHPGWSDRQREHARCLERNTVGTNADLVAAVSKDMVKKLTALTGKTVIHVPNGFDLDERDLVDRLSRSTLTPRRPFRIVYTGTIYEGLQDPLPLFGALADLHEQQKLIPGTITVDFYGERSRAAHRLAKSPKYAPFVRLMGQVPHNEALKAQRNAGLLLLLENSAPEARGVLTGKLFEYISSGRPIMCLGSRPDFEIGQLLSRTGTGAVFGPDQYAVIGDAVLQAFEGRGLYSDFAPNIDVILRYTRRRLALDMLAQIREDFASSHS